MSLNKQQIKNHYLAKIRRIGFLHLSEILPEYRLAVSELVKKGICCFEGGFYIPARTKK